MSQYIDLPASVASINGIVGAVTLAAGIGVTVTTSGSTITIASPEGDLTDTGVDGITITGGIGAVNGAGTTISQHVADISHNGYLSATDWNTFNNKLDSSHGNYITNPDAEVNTVGWNLYNNSGNTAFAFIVAQDITYTAVAAGNAGNGINIDYIFHATQSYLTPLVTVVSPTHITVAWYNGPTLANNPTATQLKAAYDAVPGAVALATSATTGTASNRQYITGANVTAQGGDTAPINGTGGVTAGVTFTRNTSTPLVGIASFDLGKDAANRQGQGVSTDFAINNFDKGAVLQISFDYSGSAGMVLGASSDVQVFMYDITNAALLPVTPKRTIAGPVSTSKTFVGQFIASQSAAYRLILHIATTSAVAWDLLLDSVMISDVINQSATTQVPSLVLPSQPISGAVTDHMVVMWRDGATQWVPATIAGAAIPAFGTDITQLGFATNIVGSVADIFIRGFMDGFSFGPFTGFDQYIDVVAGGISPLPSPFTDTYVIVGMAISSTVLNIQFDTHVDLISNGSGTPLKGGLLSNSAVNDGTGDQVLSVGTNGQALIANSAAALGINWAPAVVASAPLVYTLATRALTLSTVPISFGGTGLTTTSQSFAFIGPSGGAGAPTWRLLVAADIPTLNQNTTGSAAKWTTARLLANNSVDGSANVAFANKFVVQGTADAGLSAAQFLGALGTGIVKNTTTTGVLSIAVAGDFPTLNQNTSGNAATVTTNANLTGPITSVGNATSIASQTGTGTKFVMDTSPTLVTPNLGTPTTLVGTNITGTAAGLTAGHVTTNANLTGGVTSVGNAATVVTNANLTGPITSVGNATSIASQTGTGTKFVMDTSPSIVTPTLTGDVNASTGNILISTIGKGLQVKTGANAKIGTSVLVAGTVTVANTSVTANSRVFVTSNVDGGTPGWLRVSAKTVATSFVITSSSATDTSTVAWIIVESIP